MSRESGDKKKANKKSAARSRSLPTTSFCSSRVALLFLFSLVASLPLSLCHRCSRPLPPLRAVLLLLPTARSGQGSSSSSSGLALLSSSHEPM